MSSNAGIRVQVKRLVALRSSLRFASGQRKWAAASPCDRQTADSSASVSRVAATLSNTSPTASARSVAGDACTSSQPGAASNSGSGNARSNVKPSARNVRPKRSVVGLPIRTAKRSMTTRMRRRLHSNAPTSTSAPQNSGFAPSWRDTIRPSSTVRSPASSLPTCSGSASSLCTSIGASVRSQARRPNRSAS
jgi:hypothetical protein